ncbi:MAG: helix-turn-helix transcriptional regulator [Clostridiaceae bacterium]|nr:helix-turn-helix transcriptional regulator [Clostridiaceae bacterium]
MRLVRNSRIRTKKDYRQIYLISRRQPNRQEGYAIRRLREMRAYSQGELARKSQANLSYINSLENHPGNISISKILQICNALKITPPTIARILHALGQSQWMLRALQGNSSLYLSIAELS